MEKQELTEILEKMEEITRSLRLVLHEIDFQRERRERKEKMREKIIKDYVKHRDNEINKMLESNRRMNKILQDLNENAQETQAEKLDSFDKEFMAADKEYEVVECHN